MPPAPAPLRIDLPAPHATDALGAALARHLGAGDAVLLHGPVGAGKSHLARAVIGTARREAGLPPEPVPSPTFTLVQTYHAGGLEIWHADLYRLSDPAELAELGLEDAFAAALCLVEWPDRLGDARPPDAIDLTLGPGATDDARIATIALPPRLVHLADHL
ncbi:tRNA (adenosine(37)-N6)-threonylcarbamoyltransferase complex ATPase subunit type 1 TsaE [Jannaschia sp. LMIT008]|uniref:tRNA (adenosine(37)-N6)-threonylcarbamoyltransferase complex ATPase subunit type 1 TsaE n=1 Tax=Jannaschia maritima TaxID=3032585 RepID=UPI002812738A|nr:tRNA (adenosine(37)-N6)-threonylcarbamoyltransferase complex ATPase subunit type 1 TsaE [Jannaschia sp. LMIT008]